MIQKKLAKILVTGLLITSIGSAIPSKTDTSSIFNELQMAKTASASTDAAINTAPELTAPSAPTISLIKGGNKRIKIYWGKLSDANGYKIYYSTSKNGTYTLAKTITDKATVKYIKTGLTQNTTYYFKMTAYKTADETTAESAYSNIVSAKTGSVSATSKAAKKYTTKSKYLKSPAYKKYKALHTMSSYSKSFPIPGMKNTNTGGFACTRMIPRGICQAGAYILISAYDATGYDESVIYVLSRSSHSYITTILLPSKAKVNNLAYDGQNIWISKGSNIAYFPFSVITTAVSSGSSHYTLANYTGFFSVQTSAGVIAYHDNILWVGKSGSASASTLYGYTIEQAADGKISLTAIYTMSLPARTRGITFDNDGYMYLTRSNLKNPTQTGYMSQVRVFKPSLTSPTATGAIKKGAVISKTALPSKAEGVAMYGSYLYTLYASCQYSGIKYPADRVIAIKLAKLK